MIKWSVSDGFNASGISLDDHGVTVGDGIFESMRITQYGVFALNRHLTRLRSAAELIGIDCPADSVMASAISDVVAKLKQSGISDARLRLTVTSGTGPAGVLRGANINWFINAAAINISSSPARVTISNIVRNEYSFVSSIKTLSYIENVIALNNAVRAGFDEAILLNTKGEVAEAATSNLIFDLDGQLVTPALSCGVLRGITREILTSEFGVKEAVITTTDLSTIGGAALISSVRGVQHISHIDSAAVPGSMRIAELTEKYQQLLKSPSEYRIGI